MILSNAQRYQKPHDYQLLYDTLYFDKSSPKTCNRRRNNENQIIWLLYSATITALMVVMLLNTVGNPMGIPKDCNTGINGVVTALVASILGQKCAKQTSSGEQEEQPKT